MGAEIERLRHKVDAGANVLLTQPVYDPFALERFMDRAAVLNTPVLAGVLPLKSSRQAEYLHNEVPGITIPVELRETLRACAGDDAARRGLETACAFVDRVAGFVHGFYLMPPANFMLETLDLVAMIKAKTQPARNND